MLAVFGATLFLVGILILVVNRRLGVRVLLAAIVLVVASPFVHQMPLPDAPQVGDPAPGKVITAGCGDVVLVGARGSGESNDSQGGYGTVVGQWRDGLAKRLTDGGLTVRLAPARYPALPVSALAQDLLNPRNSTFLDSVDVGAEAVIAQVHLSTRLCTGTGHHERILLAGYSQGAWAVNMALKRMTKEERALVVAVDLFSDPGRRAGAPTPNAQRPPRGRGIWIAFGGRPLLIEDIPKVYRSWCVERDPVCDAKGDGRREAAALLTEASTPLSIHTRHYQVYGLPLSAANRAADQVLDLK